MPGVWDALQLVLAPILEDNAGPCCEILHRRGGEHLRGLSERHDPRSDVDGHATDVLLSDLQLALCERRRARRVQGVSRPHRPPTRSGLRPLVY